MYVGQIVCVGVHSLVSIVTIDGSWMSKNPPLSLYCPKEIEPLQELVRAWKFGRSVRASHDNVFWCGSARI